MKRRLYLTSICAWIALSLLVACAGAGTETIRVQQPPLKLWYGEPAKGWMTSALPIGNGELGAMFFGGVEKEQLQFNEKTLWTGSPTLRGAYQNFGDLFLEFPQHGAYSDYCRELSLDNAVGNVSYKVGGVKFLREYFASYPDKVIALRITAPGRKGGIGFTAKLKDAHPGAKTVKANRITIAGKLDLLSYEAQVSVLNEGGTLTAGEDGITVSGADAVTILLAGGTNYDIRQDTYVGETAGELHDRISRITANAAAKGYESLKKAHIDDYKPLFGRVKLNLNAPVPDMTTDLLVRSHKENRYLDILYFQYGRYLMLASSKGMNLPNNLQGIWNNSNTPPWECDIHTNINIQMNYWPAESTNLSECHLPFLNYIATEALRENGSFRNLARSENNRGWTVKTQSNIFAYTDWNINRPANAWYCMHLWQHYAYTQDTVYLRETAFPVMKATCEFWFDRLKEDAGGKLIAPDEWSPEHGPWQDGVAYAQQLVWELFSQTLKAAGVLKDETAFTAELKEKFARLDNGLEIGSWGQIKEWKEDTKNLDVQGNEHRHLSQLVALYPGNQLSYDLDSVYAGAARTTMLSRGDEGTGWSRAWKIACWARLFDGDHAYKLLKAAQNLVGHTEVKMGGLDGGVYENLLDAHPPFQIDGNFGATAGIAEMLVQSNLGFIRLLPALPSAWPDGSVEGLKAEENFTLALEWKQGKAVRCSLQSGSGNRCSVYYPGIRQAKVKDKEGNVITVGADKEDTISFPTTKGEVYTIVF